MFCTLQYRVIELEIFLIQLQKYTRHHWELSGTFLCCPHCWPWETQTRCRAQRGSCSSLLLLLNIIFHLHLLRVQPQPCCLSSPGDCPAPFRCKLGAAQQPFKYGCYWNRPWSQAFFSPHQNEMMAFLVTSQQRGASATVYSYEVKVNAQNPEDVH